MKMRGGCACSPPLDLLLGNKGRSSAVDHRGQR
jgi:hypothetical protein